MHRLLRWLVGTLASLLGLSLLLVRAGFWATGSTVVEDAQRRFSVEVMAAKYEGAYADIISRNDTRRLRIAATKDRKLAPESALPRAVPVIPLADRA